MHNLSIPKRGLTSREVIALLMMVSAQLIIGIIMLQMMLANRGTDTGIGVADVFSVQAPFNGTPYTAKMGDGEYVVKDGLKAEREKVREDSRMMMVDLKMKLDGKVAEGTNTSTYLFNVRQMISNRITSHRIFVTEKKHSLTGVLWEMIEGIYEIEEIVAMAAFYTDTDVDTDAGTGTTNTGDEAPHHLPQNKHMQTENIWTGTCHGGKVTAFHKIIEEKMEQGDIEGVLKMISESLRGFGSILQKKSREDGTGDEGMEKVRREMNGIVEGKKRKVRRGVLVSGEILRELEREMLEMEGWVGGMRDVLEGVWGEFLEGG
ncbi:hypothetical protein OCU04_010028 [Sclerotinia nivalis]|uniref:Uncharacterized protein n=1 Tax=Sclerotinia nivalis TaxID=352851 RepID=A0A9X0DFH9_9HELO|nr:hypothetical protein OCU04_010028 [Sclerotinia nivalis]